MDSNFVLLEVLFFALAGWLATCYWIVNSRYKRQIPRFSIIPLWFVWMLLALGGPVVQNTVPLTQALSSGIGLSIGMLFTIIVHLRRTHRSR